MPHTFPPNNVCGNRTIYQSRHLRRLAAATAERLKGDIPLDQPDLVLWQVGTNDALAKVPADAFKATVQNTVQWLKERRIVQGPAHAARSNIHAPNGELH